jgi:hypothetical protein
MVNNLDYNKGRNERNDMPMTHQAKEIAAILVGASPS